jgi:hypothetical protein
VSNPLASMLNALCEEHMSAGWVTDWEFTVYAAMNSGGVLELGRDVNPVLPLNVRRDLATMSTCLGVWPVFCADMSEPGYDCNTSTVMVPIYEWNALVKLRRENLPGSFTVAEGRAWLELCKTPEVVGLARVNDAYIVFVTELTPEAVRPWHGGPVTGWLPNLSVASTVHKLYGKEPGMLFDRGPERD